MSCNSIAYSSAVVQVQDLAQSLVTPQDAVTLFTAHFEAAGWGYHDYSYMYDGRRANFLVYTPAGSRLDVTYEAGRVTVTGASQAECDQVAQTLTDLINLGAGVVLQSQLVDLVRDLGTVENETWTEAGQVVLTLDI